MKNTQALVPLFMFPVLLSIGCSQVTAQESSPGNDVKKQLATAKTYDDDASTDNEQAAIRQAAAKFVDAFNHKKAKALAALWTENGDYIDESGQVFTGRAAIEQEYRAFFKQHKGIKMKLAIDSLRLLSPDAAIEDGRIILDPQPAGAPAISKYTTVHVKVDGKWLMSTVRDMRVETPSAYRNLADLDWLIGTWTAEEHGAKAEFVCRWIANKSFVERRYKVTHHDKSTHSGVEIIGYNPQNGRIQSWHFHSDGGHAVGVWSPLKNGWQSEVHGISGAGASTSAVNQLVPLDDGAYVWQSINRSSGGTEVPDTDEVILRRATVK